MSNIVKHEADFVRVLAQESTPVAMTAKEVEIREKNQRKIQNCVVLGTT